MKTLTTKQGPIGLAFENPILAVMKIDRRLFQAYLACQGASTGDTEIRRFLDLPDQRTKVIVVEGLSALSRAAASYLCEAPGVRVLLLDTPTVLTAVGATVLDMSGVSKDGTALINTPNMERLTAALKDRQDLTGLSRFVNNSHDNASTAGRLDRALTVEGISHGRESLDSETAAEIAATLSEAVYSYIFGASKPADFVGACSAAIHAGADPATVRVMQRKLRNRKSVVNAAWNVAKGNAIANLDTCSAEELTALVKTGMESSVFGSLRIPRWVKLGKVKLAKPETKTLGVPKRVIAVLRKYGVNPNMPAERWATVIRRFHAARNS